MRNDPVTELRVAVGLDASDDRSGCATVKEKREKRKDAGTHPGVLRKSGYRPYRVEWQALHEICD
jgi:hypothetical protein